MFHYYIQTSENLRFPMFSGGCTEIERRNKMGQGLWCEVPNFSRKVLQWAFSKTSAIVQERNQSGILNCRNSTFKMLGKTAFLKLFSMQQVMVQVTEYLFNVS